MSVNKVILVGNVGKDPEVRYLEGGTAVCNFSLATNENYTKNNEKRTITEWHNIVLWRNLAQIAEKFVKKGSQIYIEGRIRSRSYDDKDGIKRYVTEIIGDNMQLLGKREDNPDNQSINNVTSAPEAQPAAQSENTNNAAAPQANNNQIDDFAPGGEDGGDDLPF